MTELDFVRQFWNNNPLWTDSEKGFPVVSGSQVVTFDCDLRFTGNINSGGSINLLLNVYNSKDVWNNFIKKIDASQDWSHFEVPVILMENDVSVYPTLIWEPNSEGCSIEMHSLALRWFTCEAP